MDRMALWNSKGKDKPGQKRECRVSGSHGEATLIYNGWAVCTDCYEDLKDQTRAAAELAKPKKRGRPKKS